MKIGIVTVAYITKDKHVELAKQTYESMISQHELYKCCVINKLDSIDYRIMLSQYNNKLIDNPRNCLAQAWNLGIKDCLANDCDIVLVPNLDIILKPSSIDALASYYDKDTLVWTANQYAGSLEEFGNVTQRDVVELQNGAQYFCFVCDKRLFELVGEFDEHIEPAYWEDWDMDFRTRQKGYKTGHVNVEVFHFGSQTIKNDLDAEMFVNFNFAANREYLKNKHNVNLQNDGTIA
jgi:GT2 family glycosyltransferase